MERFVDGDTGDSYHIGCRGKVVKPEMKFPTVAKCDQCGADATTRAEGPFLSVTYYCDECNPNGVDRRMKELGIRRFLHGSLDETCYEVNLGSQEFRQVFTDGITPEQLRVIADHIEEQGDLPCE